MVTRPGNVVTVYGWKAPSGGIEPSNQTSGLDLKSCRTRRDGLLLDAGGFSVRTAQGAVLVADGSEFTAVGSDCVTGQILFDVPARDEPEYALYRSGATLFRWRIALTGARARGLPGNTGSPRP